MSATARYFWRWQIPDIPQSAITAAAAAIRRELHPGDVYTMTAGYDEALARAVLEAAAPVLAQAVARKILAHMDAHGPGPAALPGTRQAWRRHFRIAAQVAALAFTTETDRKRMAIEAIARGEAAVCHDHGEGITKEKQ